MSGSPQKQKETPLDKELASLGANMFQHYKEDIAPKENKVMNEILDDRSNSQRALDDATVNYQQAAGQVAPQVAIKSMSKGNGVGLANYGASNALALSTASANTIGASSAQALQQKAGLISYGLGQADSSLSGLNQASDNQQRAQMIQAQAKAAGREAVGDFVGTGVGLGLGYAASKPPTTTGTGLVTEKPPSNYYMNQMGNH